MVYFLRFISFFTFSVVAFFLQTTGIFKVGSINPNFLLVICAFLLIFYEKKEYFVLAPLVYLGLVIYSALFIPFWILPVLVIIIIALLVGLFNLRFTGTKILDIGLLVLILTLLFYVTLWIVGVQSLGFFVLGEMLYNILITVVLYPAIKSLVKNTK